MNSYEKFNIECSTETFAKLFGKDSLNGDYYSPRKLEIDGKNFEYRADSYQIDWLYGAKIGNLQVEGHIRKLPTEKEILKEKIQSLKVELKQAKNKLEELNDE